MILLRFEKDWLSSNSVSVTNFLMNLIRSWIDLESRDLKLLFHFCYLTDIESNWSSSSIVFSYWLYNLSFLSCWGLYFLNSHRLVCLCCVVINICFIFILALKTIIGTRVAIRIILFDRFFFLLFSQIWFSHFDFLNHSVVALDQILKRNNYRLNENRAIPHKLPLNIKIIFCRKDYNGYNSLVKTIKWRSKHYIFGNWTWCNDDLVLFKIRNLSIKFININSIDSLESVIAEI